MERVDRDEYYVVVGIDEFDHFLCLTVDIRAEETCEFTDSVVDMDNEITRLMALSSLSESASFPERALSLLSVYLWKRSKI